MGHCILLCDDEPHILRAAEFKFKRAGYEVVTAADGEEAWQAMLGRLPDIVVTDCQMPRLDGLGLAGRINNDPATAGIPVIMLSGKGFELSAHDIRRDYGIVALLPKPFSPRDLLARVETLLGDALAAPSAASSASPRDTDPVLLPL